MFKFANSFDEIATSMENNLVSEAVAKRDANINKFASAMEKLSVVAEMFDELGLEKEAEVATLLLEVIAKKKSKKPVKGKTKSKSKSKSKGKTTMNKNEDLTPEKMIDNLKNNGWVFDNNDVVDCNNADDNHSYDNNFSFDLDFGEADDEKKHTKGCMCSECYSANDFNHGLDCICNDCDGGDDFEVSEEMNSDDMFYADDEKNDEKELAKMFEKLVAPGGAPKRRQSSMTMIPVAHPETKKVVDEYFGGRSAEHRDEERMGPLDREIERYFAGAGKRDDAAYEAKRKELAKKELMNGGPGETIAPVKRNHRF